MKIVAVTACPTGIAHTYMAADALVKAAAKHKVHIKVETQGAMGIENVLSEREIENADRVLIVSDIEIESPERFNRVEVVRVPIEEVLRNVDKVFIRHARG